jgi:hypothetical protein
MCLVKTRYTLSTESTLATSMATLAEGGAEGADAEGARRDDGMHRTDGPLLATLDVRGRRAAWTLTLPDGASAANASSVALPPFSRLALDWSTYTFHSLHRRSGGKKRGRDIDDTSL